MQLLASIFSQMSASVSNARDQSKLPSRPGPPPPISHQTSPLPQLAVQYLCHFYTEQQCQVLLLLISTIVTLVKPSSRRLFCWHLRQLLTHLLQSVFATTEKSSLHVITCCQLPFLKINKEILYPTVKWLLWVGPVYKHVTFVLKLCIKTL